MVVGQSPANGPQAPCDVRRPRGIPQRHWIFLHRLAGWLHARKSQDDKKVQEQQVRSAPAVAGRVISFANMLLLFTLDEYEIPR